MTSVAVIPVFPIRLEQLRRPGPSSTFEVVTRRVDRAAPVLVADSRVLRAGGTIRAGAAGQLRIDGPFVAAGAWPAPTWRATGRLYGRGLRLAWFARVRVDLMAWSDASSEVRVQPFARHVRRWGTRRQRRYFTLAHDAADAFAALLTHPTQQETN